MAPVKKATEKKKRGRRPKVETQKVDLDKEAVAVEADIEVKEPDRAQEPEVVNESEKPSKNELMQMLEAHLKVDLVKDGEDKDINARKEEQEVESAAVKQDEIVKEVKKEKIDEERCVVADKEYD